MNVLADESVDKPIVEALRGKGFSVGYVAEMDPGISDDAVLALANSEQALLLTADKDFGELVFRLQRLSSGVILIRLAGLPPTRKADIVMSFFNKNLEQLIGSFSVITPSGIRIRRQT